MGLKYYKPTTPGRRKSSIVDSQKLARKPQAAKSLFRSKARSGGRNQQGHISVRHIGGGAKKRIRLLDRKRDKFDIPAKIRSLEYDPGRSAWLALLSYRDGEQRYILAPARASVGQIIVSSKKPLEVKPGNRTKLKHLVAGTLVHDIELTLGRGGQIVKAAGSSATVMGTEGRYAILKFPSGEIRKVLAEAMATIGQVSNADYANVRIGKAGRKRLKGIRPTVRGKAMNPVDHPHGGGEGRNPIGLKYPKTAWGKHALGVRTRKKHKSSDQLIIKRRR